MRHAALNILVEPNFVTAAYSCSVVGYRRKLVTEGRAAWLWYVWGR